MVAISMGANGGQGIFGFACRIFGTTLSMSTSIILWYMGDGRTGAVIPLLYLFTALWFYALVKWPRFAVVAIISAVTQILIVGYELGVKKTGIKLATSTGQPYYTIYLLAPYRLATVAGGLFVAFIWTFIPYPVSTHSALRRDLGSTMHLLANYYSCVHTTVDLRLSAGHKHNKKKGTPAWKLEKARSKVFSKTIVLLNKLRDNPSYLRHEPSFGGKFPKYTYDELIESMQKSVLRCYLRWSCADPVVS